MDPRRKKLIIALAAFPFLVLYMGAVLAIYDLLPDNRILELIFFVAAGTLWAFPLKPVMMWMNREPGPEELS